jgi:magnesium-transporting ATPase (P-type)
VKIGVWHCRLRPRHSVGNNETFSSKVCILKGTRLKTKVLSENPERKNFENSEASLRSVTRVILSIFVVFITLASVTFALVLRMNSDGWSILSMFTCNLVGLTAHLVSVVFVIAKRPTYSNLAIVVLANILFIATIAVQEDHGDGGKSWLVYQATLNSGEDLTEINRFHPTWYQIILLDWGYLLFFPCAILWVSPFFAEILWQALRSGVTELEK